MSHRMPPRSHHRQHPLYPAERMGACSERALDAPTFSAVDAGQQLREAEYQRYLALRETPEYQQALDAALKRVAKKEAAL